MPLLSLNPPAVDTDAASSLIYTPTQHKQGHLNDTFYLFIVILLLLLDTVVSSELVPIFFSSGGNSQKQSLMCLFF